MAPVGMYNQCALKYMIQLVAIHSSPLRLLSYDHINKPHVTIHNVKKVYSIQSLTSLGCSPCSLNLRGALLRAYLHPLKYMLQEHPKENEAPQVSGSFPWHAQVRLDKTKPHFRTQTLEQSGQGLENNRV